MNFRKTAIAVAVSFACSFAYAQDQAAPTVSQATLGHATAGLAVDPTTRKAFASNYNSGTLSVVDLDTMDVENFPVGRNPRRLVHNAFLQRTYIVNDTTPGTLTVFDTRAKEVIATIPVGDRPRGISADFQKGEVYVSNLNSNTVSVIDTATNEVTATVSVGSQPFMGGVDGFRGRIYAVSQIDRVVHVIDQETKEVIARVNTLRNPNDATVDAKTGKVYVNNVNDRLLQIIDPKSLQVEKTLPIGGGSNFGSISQSYRRYYLPNQTDFTVTVVDLDTDEVVNTISVGASPQQVAVGSDFGQMYVVNRIGNSVSVIDARTEKEIAVFAVGVNPWRIGAANGQVVVLNENGNALDSMSVSRPEPSITDTAVTAEYYHAGLDHYFHSASQSEQRLLNDGQFGNAWNLTFELFRVWTAPGTNRVAMNRFHSDSFGAKSSHAFILEGAESDSLKSGSTWKFEGIAYYVELPDAAGACRTGTVPLFRAYNNGMGGAPAHRIVADKAKRDAMVDAGWVAEGVGQDAVSACVPSQRGDEL